MKRLKNKDIAEQLGISPAAVSLAVNNKPGVSDETRAKIMALLGHEQTAHAAGMGDLPVQAQSILLTVHKRHGEIIIDKPFFSELIECIQTTAVQNHFSLVISHFTPSMDLHTYIQSLNMQNVAGVILLATEMLSEDLQYYKLLNVPMVLIDSAFDFEAIDAVTIDNTNAILHAFEYAYKMGHRDIGYLRSSVYINNFGHRHDGFQKALRAFSLMDSNHPIFSLPCSVETAYVQMKHVLETLPKGFKLPTCFLCDLDYIAIGAMNALKEFGYSVPKDVSMIGFDDVTACEICTPRLTTMHVNQGSIGQIAVSILLDKIQTPRSFYTHTQVSSELIVRDSVRRL